MSTDSPTLLNTLIAAAQREELIIERLIEAVSRQDQPAILQAAHEIATNRKPARQPAEIANHAET